jgi:hypothetical protein
MLKNFYTSKFVIKKMTSVVSPTKTVKKEYVTSDEYTGALVHLQHQLLFSNDKETVYADYKMYCDTVVDAATGDLLVVGDQSYVVRDVNPGVKPHHKEIACSYLK